MKHRLGAGGSGSAAHGPGRPSERASEPGRRRAAARRGEARLPRRRDLRIKAIEASEVWVGVGLSFLEAAPKQPPRAETQTFFCHSEARGRHLRPAFGACPTRRRYRPPARLPRRPPLRCGSSAGCSAAARPGARASSRRVEAKFGRPRPSSPPRPRRPAVPSPAGGAPSPPARPS